MNALLDSWNITAVASLESLSPFWGKTFRVETAGCSYILREMPDAPRAEREYTLLTSLLQAGAPVGPPILTETGSPWSLNEGKVYCLYPLVPGQPYKDHYCLGAAQRAERLGAATAFFHTCLLKCSSLSGYSTMDLVRQLRESVLPQVESSKELADTGRVVQLASGLIDEYAGLFAELPVQLIHRDMHPGNILFGQDQLSGWIDFDQVTRGPRIFDLCYCGTSILANGFDDPEKRPVWPELFRSLVYGYESITPLSPHERQVLFGMLAAIELFFIGWLLEQGYPTEARRDEAILSWLLINQKAIGF
jgi:Ser/Thr protein kinase RdoA (MazF antagonist)